MAIINYFQITADVINSNIQCLADQRRVSCDAIYPEVVHHLKENSKQWASNTDPDIHYENPLCRIAYLYGIAPVNANLIEYIFRTDAELNSYVEQLQTQHGKVDICVFGGGPGTELLGLTKWIVNRDVGYSFWLNYLLLDRVAEWVDSWQGMSRQIDTRFINNFGNNRSTWPIVSNGNFLPIDFTNLSNYANLGNVFGQNLYIISYVISEIFSDFSDFENLLKHILDTAPQNAKFLFIDRKGNRWKNEIVKIVNNLGLSLSKFKDTQGSMDRDEQKTDLGQIYTDVRRDPRVTWDAFWVVATKA